MSWGEGYSTGPAAMDTIAPQTMPASGAPLSDWLVGLALLAAASLAVAWLLRRAGLPGAAAIGGILAGLVLGPGVLGRFAPQTHDRLFGQAPAELAAWRQAERAVEATEFAVGSSGADPESARAQVESLVARSEARRAEWTAAAERARTPWVAVAAVLAALVIVAGGTRHAEAVGDVGRGILLGGWNAGLPAAMVAVGLGWLGEPAWSPTMFAAMAAVAAGAWPLDEVDRATARDSAPGGLAMAWVAARTANVVAIALFAAAAITASHPLAAALIAALGGTFVISALFGSRLVPASLATVLVGGAVPVLAALAAVRVEPFLDVRWGVLILLAVVAEDGRWIGATLGTWLPGGVPFLGAMRLGLVAVPAAPMMLAFVAVSLSAGLLAPAAGAGLLVGVLLIEGLAPVRHRMAADLAGPGSPPDGPAGG